MFIHTVYFWAVPDLSDADRKAFEAGLATLPGVPGVVKGYWGVPAATRRPVIDASYAYGLTLVFPDRAAQDAYQDHPIHQRFVETCSRYWKRVVVYDVAAQA